MSLSLNNFLYEEWKNQLPLIVDEIIKQDADVVALQNVRGLISDLDNNAIKHLQDALKEKNNEFFWVVVQPVMRHAEDPENWEGLAILSRIAFIDSRCQVLPIGEGEDKKLRSIIYGRYKLSDCFFYIFNNYFSFDNQQAILDAVNGHAFTVGCPEHALFLGDFNSTPEMEPVKKLKEHGWIDTWEMMHPDKIGFTYPSSDPGKRTSFVFHSKGFESRIKDIKVVFAEPDDNGLYPSNHLGLLIDID